MKIVVLVHGIVLEVVETYHTRILNCAPNIDIRTFYLQLN